MLNRYAFFSMIILGGVVAFASSFAQTEVLDIAGTEPGLIKVQAHTGQLDTDGILSLGEVPNPNIDYDRAQRSNRRQGHNRYNNSTSQEFAEHHRRGRYDMDWRERRAAEERKRREHEEREWKDREERRDDNDDRRRSWWNWQ